MIDINAGRHMIGLPAFFVIENKLLKYALTLHIPR